MLSANSSKIFIYLIDYCLTYWLGRFVSEDVFQNHKKLARILRSMSDTKNDSSNCILVNVISFSNYLISKGHQITSVRFLDQLKNSFEKLFSELDDISADLLNKLHYNFELLVVLESAFYFTAQRPTVNLGEMKTKVDDLNSKIDEDIQFIRKVKLYFSTIMQTKFREVVSLTDCSNDRSHSSITEIRRIRRELLKFSSFFSDSLKSFFLHFATSSEKSVLFEKTIPFPDPSTASFSTLSVLAQHISSVEKYLQKICTTKLTIQEVLNISEHFSHSNRKPALEMKLLHDYFSAVTHQSEVHIQSFIKIQDDVMNLFSTREQLVELVFGNDSKPSILAQLRFSFKDDDDAFQQLQHAVNKLRNKEHLLNVTSDECVNILHAIHLCFGSTNTSNKVDVLRGVIKLFKNLTEADKVWKFFVNRPDFVSDEQSFNNKLDELFAELSREDNLRVDSFRAASFWVCLVLPTVGKPFSYVVSNIIQSERFNREIVYPSKFNELGASQLHMDFITHLFQYGCTGLDSVLEQFKCQALKSSIEFDLMSHQLQVRYYDDKRKSEVLMSSDQVIEFEQRLEFIQNEEKAPNHDIFVFLKQLAIYRRGINVLCELFEFGHPLYKTSVFILNSEEFNRHSRSVELMDATAWVEVLQGDLDAWVAKIEDARTNDPVLRLFTIKQARRIASLVVDGSIYKLFNSVAHLFVDEVSKRPEVLSALQISVARHSTFRTAEDDWLIILKTFFRELSRNGVSQVHSPSMGDKCSTNNIRYNISSTDPSSIKKLLCYIFESQRPESFQLLWCTVQLKKEDILNYLIVAKTFPNLLFVVVQFNLLNQSVQNLFFKTILQDKDIKNLRFVECGPSIMKSASWLLPVIEAVDVLDNIDLYAEYGKWYSNAGDALSTDNGNYSCFVGPSGSGKSHQIRELMKQFPKSIIIPITEEFDWDEILPRMSEGLASNTDENLLLVFQVNIGKLRKNAVERWTTLMGKIDDLMFQLLILRSVAVLNSEFIVNLPWGSNCTVALELPHREHHLDGIKTDPPTEYELLPTVHTVFKFVDASKFPFDINEESKMVCKFLKAYDTGLIDTLYGPDLTDTEIVFVLDCSSSMLFNDRLKICKDSLKTIMDSNLRPTFRVGLVLFHTTVTVVPLAPMEFNRETLKIKIDQASTGGGSNMWTALKQAVEMLPSARTYTKQIIVALTDGEASANKQVAESVTESLSKSHRNVQVIFITVKLNVGSRNEIRKRCIRNPRDKLVDAEDGKSLFTAWIKVGDILTVSQIIEKGAADITSEECNRLLDKYMINRNAWSKFQQVFWVRYMYRRCKILESSERFNTNRDKLDFGKTTMEIMLNEVERALSNNHQVDWNSLRHEQMVFRKQLMVIDDVEHENYTWSILCSNPNDQDLEWVERKEELKRHGIQVPTIEDMGRSDRRVLDSYLAYGIGVDLEEMRAEKSSSGSPFDFQLGSLYLPHTVLTLDFTIKLLTINERVECGIPCIMQGETGVSKTELVRMLFTLKNGSMRESALFLQLKPDLTSNVRPSFDAQKLRALQLIAKHWKLDHLNNVYASWRDYDQLIDAIRVSCTDSKLLKLIFDELKANPVLDPLEHFTDHYKFKEARNSIKLLEWFIEAVLKHSVHDVYWTFFSVNIHSAMKVKDIERIVMSVSHKARRIIQLGEYLDSPMHKNTKLCLFFDEFNTSNHMGIMKEVITNHTINGVNIASNVVIVAACNPARMKLNFFSDRKQEHGIEWVSGHYQTHPLPPSIEAIVWNYGSLLPNQEKEFIKKRLELLPDAKIKTSTEMSELTNLIYQAHQITRELTRQHLQSLVDDSGVKISPDEVIARANSALSLRDILRCFKIFQYLSSSPTAVKKTLIGDNVGDKYTWLLAIGIVYYLRLGVDTSNPDRNYRRKFMNKFKSSFVDADVQGYTKEAMKELMKHTDLQPGIAPTDGLQENVYVVFVCLMAKVPAMIVGPPGASKTLAISILVDNARGVYSKKEIYKSVSKVIPFHYQCSRRSTSTQVEEVFKRAIERQAIALKEAEQVVCFVFMDEAGLPEEGRESLKVLHYYLENHLKVQAEVGFVAISNHVLDAAKTNRCTLVMRNHPDEDELLEITKGCSQQQLDWNLCSCYISSIEPDKTIRELYVNDREVKYNLFKYLCKSFVASISKIDDFLEFFGLRDYMNFIALLGRSARRENVINRRIIYNALERNFNGFSKLMTKNIITHFMGRFLNLNSEPIKMIRLSNPIDLLVASLNEQFNSNEPTGRYVLLIDTTTCDGIIRFLVEHVVGQVRKLPKLLKLSDFAEDSHTQQMNLISQTRFAMERGDFIVLSHCETTHESFYDLFNHHFEKFFDRQEGKDIYHTNISIGGDSRRCRVDPKFQCLMHLTVAELNIAPAPFLNRFENYKITMMDALEFILSNHPCRFDFPLATVVEKVLLHLRSLFGLVGYESFIGYAHKQTVESCFVKILLNLNSVRAIQSYVLRDVRSAANSLSSQDRVDLDTARANKCLIRDYFKYPIDERIKEIGVVLLAQSVLLDAAKFFVDISFPESLLAKSAFLPSSLIEMVVTMDKFRLDLSRNHTKRIIFTRSTTALVDLQAMSQRLQRINFIALSDYKKESQFSEEVALFLKSGSSIDHMIVVIDLCSAPSSMINFVRNKLESVHSTDKGFTILIHGANVDIRSHCIYDVVFDKNWEQKFIDSFCDTCDLSWLQIAYTADISNSTKIYEMLCKNTDFFVPLALKVISERLAISGEGGGSATKNKLRDALDVFLRQNLVESYAKFWLTTPWSVGDADIAQDAPTSYSKLRKEIQSIVQKYAVNSFNKSLLQYIAEEMKSMFTRFFEYYVGAVFEDISVGYFIENAINGIIMNLLLDGLRTLPQPDLSILNAPINYLQIQMSQEKSFPFFRRLHCFMQVQVSKVVLLYNINEDESADLIANYIEQQDVFEARFFIHVRAVEDSVWKLYLEKFVSVKFPGASYLQCSFLSFWLDKKVRYISEINNLDSSKIALLYMACASHEGLLRSFLDCLNQIQFSTTKESVQRYLDGFSQNDQINSGASLVTLGFIKICYDAMRSCSSCDEYSSWTQSVSSLLLKPVGELLNCDNGQLKKMTAVMTVSSLLKEKKWNVSNLSDFREKMHNEDSSVPFSRILDHFKSSLSKDIDLDVLTLLIRNTGVRLVAVASIPEARIVDQFEMNCQTSMMPQKTLLSNTDKVWIMDNIMDSIIIVDTVMTSPIKWAPLLDILLFGIIDVNAVMFSTFSTSMVQWVEFVADTKLLDTRLESRDNSADYMPDFLREFGDQSSFPLIADVAFHLIWKWIHTFSASDALIVEIHSLKQELYNISQRSDDAQNVIKIVAVAYDLFIIKQWIDSISTTNSSAGEEIQSILTDIIENRKPRENWITYCRRLFLQTNTCGRLDFQNELIQRWSTENCEKNLTLREWLEDCKIQVDSKFEDFSFQSCWNISRSSHSDEDPINLTDSLSHCSAISFAVGLDSLMSIWVLPYIWEFYRWLTDEFKTYEVPVQDVQALKIGQVIENCRNHPDPRYHIYYVSLWAKLKIGIRQYISKSGYLKGLNELDEATVVKDVVSTCNHTGTQNGTLIEIMEAIIKDCKPILHGLDCSTSDKSAVTFTHIKNVEKLSSFSPEIIDRDLNADADNYAELFLEKLSDCTQIMSHFGIWQRLLWISETQQNPLLLDMEIQRIRSIIPELLHLRIKPIFCTFSGDSQSLFAVSESCFDQIFHSLEKLEINSLLRSLQFYYESIMNSDGSESLQQILETVHGRNSFDVSKIFGINESNQISFLELLQFKEVPKLILYCNDLLQSEMFLFSNKPLELKKTWPCLLDEKLNHLPREDSQFSRNARQLEALLIEHELALSDNCDSVLTSVLERCFKSTDVLLMQFPLLKDILTVFETFNSCSLLCGHYVLLRLKLRSWIASFKSRTPDKAWSWSIKSSAVNNSEMVSHPISKLQKVPYSSCTGSLPTRNRYQKALEREEGCEENSEILEGS